ncbi:MAG: hypothetical protein ABJA78_14110 [Ferruginibacter sp.]
MLRALSILILLSFITHCEAQIISLPEMYGMSYSEPVYENDRPHREFTWTLEIFADSTFILRKKEICDYCWYQSSVTKVIGKLDKWKSKSILTGLEDKKLYESWNLKKLKFYKKNLYVSAFEKGDDYFIIEDTDTYHSNDTIRLKKLNLAVYFYLELKFQNQVSFFDSIPPNMFSNAYKPPRIILDPLNN